MGLRLELTCRTGDTRDGMRDVYRRSEYATFTGGEPRPIFCSKVETESLSPIERMVYDSDGPLGRFRR